MPPAAALSRVARGSAFVALIPAVVLAASTTQAAPPVESAASSTASAPATTESNQFIGIRLKTVADPDNYYPAVAKSEKVTGYAIVEVDVDVLGQLVDARVLDVQPADPRFGFADAALQLARNNSYGNTTQQVGSMKFKVKFDLTE
jgi:outer membrane biosynthesis protein TonB